VPEAHDLSAIDWREASPVARIRSLKPEAFQSETLSEVSVYAERTFFGLSTQVDDRGRIADKPVVLNAALWAVRGEREPHTAKDFETELAELVEVGLVCRYVGCDGRRFLHLVTWDDHQKIDRASRSRVPRCPRHQLDDECGKHAKAPCLSATFPEDPASGSDGTNVSDESSTNTSDDPTNTREGSSSTREDVTNAIESPMQDLGPWTVDRGSGIVPPSAGPDQPGTALVLVAEIATEAKTEPPFEQAKAATKPRKSRKKPDRTPLDDQADELTNGFWDLYQANQAQKWIAIRQIVLTALKNGADRNHLAWALDLVGREHKPVTGPILTIALGVIKQTRAQADKSGPPVSADRRQQATNDLFARALERARARDAQEAS
jgi:hypothetical protein